MRALTLVTALLALLCMAPNRRPHDHIGNFNFTFQVLGATSNGIVLGSTETKSVSCPDAGDAEHKGLRFRVVLSPQQHAYLTEGRHQVWMLGKSGAGVVFGRLSVDETVERDGVTGVLATYASCQVASAPPGG